MNRPIGVLMMAYGGPNSLDEIPGYLADVAACGGDVIGVDFRLPLGRAWESIGFERAIQGNLDPAALLAPWRELQFQAGRVLEEAAGRTGHIFNLGHGLFQATPEENVRRLVDAVHEMTRRPLPGAGHAIPQAAGQPGKVGQ